MRAGIARLEKRYTDIVRCAVVIEAPHRQHHQGNVFHVRVRITLPGGELVVARDPGLHHAHEDVFVAVHDALRAARRELMNEMRVRRGQVKVHEGPLPAGA